MTRQDFARAVLFAGVLALLVLGIPAADALSTRLATVDQWRVSCPAAADAGIAALTAVVDGGTASTFGISSVSVTNPSATCIHVGRRTGAVQPLNSNTGIEIGDGCINGPSWNPDVAIDNLGCQSEGAATLLRVVVGRQ